MSLLDRIQKAGQRRHLARATIDAYRSWVGQFLRFHRRGDEWTHPIELRGPEVEAFLNYLASSRHLSASSTNQALCGIVFLYRRVLLPELAEKYGSDAGCPICVLASTPVGHPATRHSRAIQSRGEFHLTAFSHRAHA